MSEIGAARILVVEDRFILADDIQHALSEYGAVIIGPVASVDEAREHASSDDLDLAILDVDLRDGTVYSVAELLTSRGIPYIFATGYARHALPEAFRNAPYISKPVSQRQIVAAVKTLLRENARPSGSS